MSDQDAMTMLQLMEKSHHQACVSGFWPHGERNVGEAMALIHSEVSEALEAHRKNLGNDAVAEELADVIIRIADLAQGLRLPLCEAIKKKMDYNAVRLDHQPAYRAGDGGKKY